MISTSILDRPSPNIRTLNFKVDGTGSRGIYDKVEMCTRLDWTALGKSLRRWNTLKHLNIEIQLMEEGMVLERLREFIREAMDGVKHVLVFT